jgi:hypothetical protein
MFKRAQAILFFMLVLTAVALLGYAQVWAQSGSGLPCTTVQVFDEQIRVTFDQNCEVILNVEFCTEDPPDPPCTSWANYSKKVTAPVICVCTGADCDPDISVNIANKDNPDKDVTLECSRMKGTGALGQGCPFFNLPGYGYLGDIYRR